MWKGQLSARRGGVDALRQHPEVHLARSERGRQSRSSPTSTSTCSLNPGRGRRWDDAVVSDTGCSIENEQNDTNTSLGTDVC
jgi:hypothetical protein